jgi:hypothetical protein
MIYADDHRLDPGILDGTRRPRSRLVPKTFEPMLGEASPPLADRVGIDSRRTAATLLCSPSAHARTIRARSAKACVVLRRNASDVNSARSTSFNPAEQSVDPSPILPKIWRVRYHRVDLESAELLIQDTGEGRERVKGRG